MSRKTKIDNPFFKKNNPDSLKNSSLNFNRKRKKAKTDRNAGLWILIVEIIGTVFLAYIVVSVFFTTSLVVGDSMSPTLSNGNHVLLNKLPCTVFSPQRNDVVAFSVTNNPNAEYSFKRIIGLPGETIQIKDGYVYIDGKAYEDKEPRDRIDDVGALGNELLLNEDEYFVLGDNRNNSEDSRYSSIGPISKKDMVGKAWFCYSPDNLGLIFN